MEEEKKINEFKEVTKEIIGWEDNKLFRTLKGLTISPGQTRVIAVLISKSTYPYSLLSRSDCY